MENTGIIQAGEHTGTLAQLVTERVRNKKDRGLLTRLRDSTDSVVSLFSFVGMLIRSSKLNPVNWTHICLNMHMYLFGYERLSFWTWDFHINSLCNFESKLFNGFTRKWISYQSYDTRHSWNQMRFSNLINQYR